MLDETDIGILGILKENARTSFLNIAKKLKISESTVRKRMARLEKGNIIKKYTTVVEPSKLGYGSVALVGIDSKPENFLSVAKKLTELENVKFVATSSGDHMIMVEIWMENSNELRGFIREKIESLEGVTRTCPAILNEVLKEI
ncbi:MAG TPA: Lrp/AsnC family transcriptional regulator [Candidatus Nanoarchaeia archaeon]|nr:Lrp/AsnC family transcriptional regulator [Candidatus Nanoarchaeia archaeon]